jgi:hypothetical protein
MLKISIGAKKTRHTSYPVSNCCQTYDVTGTCIAGTIIFDFGNALQLVVLVVPKV